MGNKYNSKAYNRDISRRKAIRKRRLDAAISWCGCPMYNNLHQYSKNKIHCSCPDCSPKTRNKGRRNRKNYHKSLNYKYSDLVKMLSMDDSWEEYSGQKIHRRPAGW